VGGVEEISSKCCKFFKCGKNQSSSFFKLLNFKVKVFGREFFELLRISTLKFEKVCGREFFDSLKVGGVCKRGFGVVERIKLCAIKDLQVLEVFFSSLREVSKIYTKVFNLLRRMFVVAFVFKCLLFKRSP
jgi:hypothetical protein